MNFNIKNIIDAIHSDHIRITDHADEEAQADKLTYKEIYYSVFQGEVIENYPEDEPYPSCLIYGETFSGNPVHSVWAFNEVTQWSVLVTVYRPDPYLWINYRTRKKKS